MLQNAEGTINITHLSNEKGTLIMYITKNTTRNLEIEVSVISYDKQYISGRVLGADNTNDLKEVSFPVDDSIVIKDGNGKSVDFSYMYIGTHIRGKFKGYVENTKPTDLIEVIEIIVLNESSLNQ